MVRWLVSKGVDVFRSVAFLFGLFATALVGVAAASPISIVETDGMVGSVAKSGWSGPKDLDFLAGGEIGSEFTQASSGGASSQTAFNYAATDTQATFDIAFDHTTGASPGDLARSRMDTLRIVTNTDTEFSLSGEYLSMGVGRTSFAVSIVDNTTGNVVANYLYDVSQGSDQAFVLGGSNSSSGSTKAWGEDGVLTGVLAAGGDYSISFDAFTVSQWSGAMDASGAVSLSFNSLSPVYASGGFASVPAPGGATLLVLGLSAIAWSRRRY